MLPPKVFDTTDGGDVDEDYLASLSDDGPLVMGAPVSRHLPDHLWAARPELARVRQWAHARGRSADALLGAVIGRVAVLSPPTLTIDTGIGTPASLNMLIGLVGPSGAGKTSATEIARELIPICRRDLAVDLPLGSGEGLVEIFHETVLEDDGKGRQVKVRRRTKTGALLTLDEGQALTELAGRKGSTLLPTLRSAWSGATLGQTNARDETRRILEAGTYRLALLVGFQAAAAGALLGDWETGTPQRFVLFNATDPSIPDQPPNVPTDPVLARVPHTAAGQPITVSRAVCAEVRGRQLEVQRGRLLLDPLDSHRDLSRLKVAALLGVMAGRCSIESEDWDLAGIILDTSDAVRRWVANTNQAAEQQREDWRTRTTVTRQRVVAQALEADHHQRAVTGGARAMARHAHKRAGHTITRRELSRAPAGKQRDAAGIDEMIAHAEEMCWIRADGDGWCAGKARPT